MPKPEKLGPFDRLHKNVFEQLVADNFPVKINGKVVGTGKLMPDGSVDMDIFDEDAKKKLSDGSVKSLSVDNNSHTIIAIMENRERKGL